VVAALAEAVRQFVEEGGQPARLARYRDNCETLVSGMRGLGFKPFLKPEIQAPIIVTFHAPTDTRYTFREFYDRVRDKGFILYPGKLTQVETFRVGCIGAIGPDEMRHAVNAIRDTIAEMGIRRVAPATSTRAAA
jgi:2-aminoethylphosphonate-pyruvate transaminase